MGAALAEAGPRDRFALATPTLILAANVPDVDILTYPLAGEFAALAWRRGITHGVPALVVWPFVVVALMLGWDRLVRRRRDPSVAPARAGPLLVLAAIGAATHPALDWLNTYGMRWWLPVDGAWSYGDAVFIMDPWLWLALGGAVFLARSGRWGAVAGWAALAATASLLVLGVGRVPTGARIAWVLGLVGLAIARWRMPFPRDARLRRLAARVAVGGAAAYVGLLLAMAAIAEREAGTAAAAAGLDPVDVMAGPVPANPLVREILVATPTAYVRGTWRAGWRPRVDVDVEAGGIPRRRGPPGVVDRAFEDARVRDFLVWSRYPYAHATETADGWRVRIGDARYEGGGLGGLEVHIITRGDS